MSPSAKKTAAPRGDALDDAILRFLRTTPSRQRDLAPLAERLGVEPTEMQLAVERLGKRRMVVLPFVEPGPAGGAILAERGLAWLIGREGGTPRDTPTAYQPAGGRVRAEDEAARLPRAQVYGVKRPG